MALVYEGRRESLAGVSPRVAIKLILPEHAGSETFRQLFINEARLGAKMAHQNLVHIQDFDSEGDTFFLVMEYVEGITLRRIISQSHRHSRSVPLVVVAELGRQACDGLHFAHGACDDDGVPLELVHRDMKPSNLILNPQGVVKVLDFGISKGRLRTERKGSVKGTWGYMAPEQAGGEDVHPAADVFGLAVVLYELCSQRPMFQDKKKDEIRRLLKDDHAARMAATLDGARYGPLIPLLVRALQRDPAARYSQAADFGRALSSLLPDPITARDEVVRYFNEIQATVPECSAAVPTAAPVGTGPGSLVVSPSRSPEGDPSLGGLLTFGVGAVLSLFVLGGVLLMALSDSGAVADSDADPTHQGPPRLPAPQAVAPVELGEPAGPAGVGAPGERGDRGAVPPPPEGAGVVVLDSRQPAEVYIAGAVRRSHAGRGASAPRALHGELGGQGWAPSGVRGSGRARWAGSQGVGL